MRIGEETQWHGRLATTDSSQRTGVSSVEAARRPGASTGATKLQSGSPRSCPRRLQQQRRSAESNSVDAIDASAHSSWFSSVQAPCVTAADALARRLTATATRSGLTVPASSIPHVSAESAVDPLHARTDATLDSRSVHRAAVKERCCARVRRRRDKRRYGWVACDGPKTRPGSSVDIGRALLTALAARARWAAYSRRAAGLGTIARRRIRSCSTASVRRSRICCSTSSSASALADFASDRRSRSETDFFVGDPLRALTTLSYSDNVDLQRSAALAFAEITEKDVREVTRDTLDPILVRT